MGNSDSSDRGGSGGGSSNSGNSGRCSAFRDSSSGGSFNSGSYMNDRAERIVRDHSSSNNSCKPERNNDRESSKSCVFKDTNSFSAKSYANDRVERTIKEHSSQSNTNKPDKVQTNDTKPSPSKSSTITQTVNKCVTESIGTNKHDLDVAKCVVSNTFNKTVESLPEKYQDVGKKITEQSGGVTERISKAFAQEVTKDSSPGTLNDIQTGIIQCGIQAKINGDNDYTALKCVADHVMEKKYRDDNK
jgi:hypothetical protein